MIETVCSVKSWSRPGVLFGVFGRVRIHGPRATNPGPIVSTNKKLKLNLSPLVQDIVQDRTQICQELIIWEASGRSDSRRCPHLLFISILEMLRRQEQKTLLDAYKKRSSDVVV